MNQKRDSQNEDGRDTKEAVSEWLHKTGLPLEVEALAAFASGGFGVQHSTLYVDPDTGKAREIDVTAWRLGKDARSYVQYNIECKASGRPWVVVRSNQESQFFPYPGMLGVVSQAILKSDSLIKLLLDPAVHSLRTGGYQLKQAFSGDLDPAHAAAISVFKSCAWVLSESPELNVDYVTVQPVIVVDSKLFECEVRQDGAIDLQEVDVSAFRFVTGGQDRRPTVIRVATKQGLPKLVESCNEMADAIIRYFPGDED